MDYCSEVSRQICSSDANQRRRRPALCSLVERYALVSGSIALTITEANQNTIYCRWFAHACNDNVISVSETDTLVEAMRKLNAVDVNYTRYEQVFGEETEGKLNGP